MKALDNQKDEFIKEKLQKDDLISKKADDVFNNFLKGDVNMKEEEKVVKLDSSEKKANILFKRKKFMAVAASLVVVFLAVNGYAATRGYNNIFFMIKRAVSGEAGIIDKEDILSDRDITISYSSIHLSEDISIQINKLQIEKNEAKLYLSVTEHTGNDYISKIIVRDNETQTILSDEMFANKATSTGEEITYQKVINLKGITNDLKELSLEIINSKNTSLSTLLVNLENKEIDVLNGGYDTTFEKISEIEVKKEFGKLLKAVPELGGETDPEEATKFARLFVALNYVGEKDGYDNLTKENVLKAYNEIFGTNETDPEKLLVKGNKFMTYSAGKFEYSPMDAETEVLVLDVQDLKYADGVYTATIVYSMPGDGDYVSETVESLPQFMTSVEFTINKDYKYSKFQFYSPDNLDRIDYSGEEEVTENSPINENNNNDNNSESILTPSEPTTNTVGEESITETSTNTVTNNNTTPNNYDISKVDNYASSMSWSDYWSPGLKLSYPTIFSLVESGGYTRGSNQGALATTIFGLAVGINKDTNTIVESNMTIEIFEPAIEQLTTDYEINEYIYGLTGGRTHGAGFTNSEDDFWALVSNDDPNVEEYFHTEPLSEGYSAIYRIRISCDNRENYKVTNIINRLLGSLKVTSY